MRRWQLLDRVRRPTAVSGVSGITLQRDGTLCAAALNHADVCQPWPGFKGGAALILPLIVTLKGLSPEWEASWRASDGTAAAQHSTRSARARAAAPSANGESCSAMSSSGTKRRRKMDASASLCTACPQQIRYHWDRLGMTFVNSCCN